LSFKDKFGLNLHFNKQIILNEKFYYFLEIKEKIAFDKIVVLMDLEYKNSEDLSKKAFAK